MIKDFPELEFVGGGEESFGYLVGDFVRDKDAVTATLLACEIAAQKKESGSSMFQYLNDVYNEFGHYREHLISVTKKGKRGAAEIAAIMKNLRENPFKEIAGSKVVRMDDISKSESTDFTKQETLSLNLPNSNVLLFYTEDGSKIAVRPSGTEPKIKFYISVNTSEKENFEDILQKRIDAIAAQLNKS